MEKFKSTFIVFLIFTFFHSFSQDQLRVSKVHKNSISNMKGLIDIANEKAGFTKNNQSD